MQYIVAVLTVAFLFLYWKLGDKVRAAWMIRKLPTPAGSLLAGHVSIMAGRYPHRHVQKWARELGSIFRIRTLWEQVILGLARTRSGARNKPGVPAARMRWSDHPSSNVYTRWLSSTDVSALRAVQIVVVADPFVYNELLQLERAGGLEKPGGLLTGHHNILTEFTRNPLWKATRKVSA